MQPQQIELDTEAVFATIGRLTMMNAALRKELDQVRQQLAELLPETPAENGTVKTEEVRA